MEDLSTSPDGLSRSIQIVIPVLNEQAILARSISAVYKYMSENFTSYDWHILIVDNGSTDSTQEVARNISQDLINVDVLVLEERGRGRAVSRGWLEKNADIHIYMDVDLSTEMQTLQKLVNAIDVDGYDIAIASRLKAGSKVIGRPLHREFISRAYSFIVRSIFLMKIKDYQCGCKAISRNTARDILPIIEDTGWFFDTELIILASYNKYSINEIPVIWTDDTDSRVRIFSTVITDLNGLIRLRFGGLRRASRLLRMKDKN